MFQLSNTKNTNKRNLNIIFIATNKLVISAFKTYHNAPTSYCGTKNYRICTIKKITITKIIIIHGSM